MPRQERAFRTEGIILRRLDYGEADRILTVFTPQQGKLSLIAKGARKPTSTKTGHVELFTRADMLIHRGRDLSILTQVEMIAPYLAIREDLQRGAYASYAMELLDRFTSEGEEDQSALFTLVTDTLERLCHDDDPRLVVRYYEMRLLDLAGFRPELNECVISRAPIIAQDQYFSYAEGGVIQPDAVLQGTHLVSIPLQTLKLLRHMQRSPYSHVKSLKISRTLHDDAERILLGYITHLLEHKLQSVDFIRRIRQKPFKG